MQRYLRHKLLDRAGKKAARIAQKTVGKDAIWTCTYVRRQESDKHKSTTKVQEEEKQAEVSDDDPVSSGAEATPIRLGSGGACKMFCFVCVFRLETVQNVGYCPCRRSR